MGYVPHAQPSEVAGAACYPAEQSEKSLQIWLHFVAGLAAAWLCASRAIKISARYQSRYYWADDSFGFFALDCRHLQLLCEREVLT